jgi:hypothetical protein
VTRPRAAAAVAYLLLTLQACDRSVPVQQEAARVPPPAPPAASRAAEASAPSAPALQSAAPQPERRDRRDRRLERRSQRAERAFAAGPVEIAEAQRQQLHGRLVEFDATVDKLLRADRRGLKHQRFVVRVAGAGTVLVAHNTDLAAEVPLAVGERVRVRGLFEWNQRGGVVHWTHHDPAGGSGGGWIRAAGRTYQ